MNAVTGHTGHGKEQDTAPLLNDQSASPDAQVILTLVLLNPDIPCFANSVNPDQLASEEAN